MLDPCPLISKTMKTSIRIVLTGFCLFAGCKTKHIDSEPSIAVNFYKLKDWKGKTLCFKSIRGDGFGNINPNCVDSLNFTVDLPLNLKSYHTRYIFDRDSIIDTLEVRYGISVGNGDDAFKANVTNFVIVHATFDSLALNKGKKTLKQNEAENIDIFL